MFPLFPFKSDKIWKAFIIHSIQIALITAFTIEFRFFIDEFSTYTMLPSLFIAFFSSMFALFLTRILFGSGEAFIPSGKPHSLLF